MLRPTLKRASLALLTLPLLAMQQAFAEEAVALKYDPQFQLGSDQQVEVEVKRTRP